jgi:hypothetical protein
MLSQHVQQIQLHNMQKQGKVQKVSSCWCWSLHLSGWRCVHVLCTEATTVERAAGPVLNVNTVLQGVQVGKFRHHTAHHAQLS